jgi:hypothetical protein
MIFRRVKDADPEKIFIIVQNSWTSAALQSGYCVQWDFLDAIDGVGVSQPSGMATNLGNACAGIVVQEIGIGDFGLVQVYGYNGAVRARVCTTADNIVLGSGIRPPLAAAAWCVEGHDPNGTLNYHCIGFAMSIWSSWTSTTIKAFIKAL